MKTTLSIIFCTLVAAFGCDTEETQKLYTELLGKEIIMPNDAVYTIMPSDTVTNGHMPTVKIVNYIDSIGCIRCKSQLPAWDVFINTLDTLTHRDVPVLTFMHPSKYSDAVIAIKKDNYRHPVCIDRTDEFNRLNRLPKDDRFRCSLLDENNRVILIGNPVQNPKIKDLYIRTICERLGIEYVHNPDENPRISLGTIKKDEPKNVCFEIRNDGDATMQIDTIFTSCECTTAKIDRMQIQRNETAIISVTYTPDGAGDFVRDAYVKVNGKEQPKIFTIEGTVK